MIRLSRTFAVIGTVLMLACGGGSSTPDVVDDVIIGVDVSTVDAAYDTSIQDVVTSDRPAPLDDVIDDTPTPEDLGNLDVKPDDVVDAGRTDTSLDTTVEPAGWVKMAVTIDDPVVNGTYLMNPVDGISFGYQPETREFITEFDRDYNDSSITFLWHLDEVEGIHSKKYLDGEPFEDGTNFCMDEDWCQFIGFDASDSTWVVMGPRSPAVMKVDVDFNALQYDLLAGETDQPPNGAISYTHLFTGDGFWVYGYITASSFGTSLLFFDLLQNDWTTVMTDLPPVYMNCLAMDTTNGIMYSVGGISTDDGGETSYTYDKLQAFDVEEGTTVTTDLPLELATREGMACAMDAATGKLYVSGGALIVDNYDERSNTYHNDLWVWDGSDWTQVLADGEIGEFRQYGDNWMLKADATLPNFGKNAGKMMFDEGLDRLILMGDVPGSATQVYTLNLSDLEQ